MAKHALGLPGERHGVLPDGFQRARAVVAILAESLGNDCHPDQQEDAKPRDQNGRRTDKMSRIPENAAQHNPLQ
jgi:hypothetical protein